nr:putative ribonuclease h protein [Quercus suber]
MAGGGGLIRDHNGAWICGFARQIGHASSVMAELWAVRDGLSLTISMGFSHVFVELDALLAVNFLLNRSKVQPRLMTLVITGRYCKGSLTFMFLTFIVRATSALMLWPIWVEPIWLLLLYFHPFLSLFRG